jgi:hypothetical protein
VRSVRNCAWISIFLFVFWLFFYSKNTSCKMYVEKRKPIFCFNFVYLDITCPTCSMKWIDTLFHMVCVWNVPLLATLYFSTKLSMLLSWHSGMTNHDIKSKSLFDREKVPDQFWNVVIIFIKQHPQGLSAKINGCIFVFYQAQGDIFHVYIMAKNR